MVASSRVQGRLVTCSEWTWVVAVDRTLLAAVDPAVADWVRKIDQVPVGFVIV